MKGKRYSNEPIINALNHFIRIANALALRMRLA